MRRLQRFYVLTTILQSLGWTGHQATRPSSWTSKRTHTLIFHSQDSPPWQRSIFLGSWPIHSKHRVFHSSHILVLRSFFTICSLSLSMASGNIACKLATVVNFPFLKCRDTQKQGAFETNKLLVRRIAHFYKRMYWQSGGYLESSCLCFNIEYPNWRVVIQTSHNFLQRLPPREWLSSALVLRNI